MKRKLVCVLEFVFLSIAYAQSPAGDCAECRSVLAGGVFNTANINLTEASKSAFMAWQCATNFQTHDEAIGAGISVGVPVYGVPLKVGGTYTNDQRNQWKSANCSSSASANDSFRLKTVAMREAAPAILAAWTKCIETACGRDRTALACSATNSVGGGIFRANWIRTAGDSTPPKIQYFKVYDAACSPTLTINTTISEAGIAIKCDVPTNKEAVMILQTNRGTCTPTLLGVVSAENISGKVVLTDNKNYKAQRIVFGPDAVIVTNGYRLTFDADEFIFQGAPKILSFEQTAPTGLSAGAILLKARKLSGTSLIINNVGQPGTNGAAGSAGAKGPRGPKGTSRDWNPFNGCIGGSNGGTGGRGGDGGDGGPGGAGGNGGTFIYDVEVGLTDGALQRLVIDTAGGLGGKGGAPGPPGPGGDGGEGANGTATCGGTGPGSQGSPGNPGRRGPDGPQGARGQIVNYRN